MQQHIPIRTSSPRPRPKNCHSFWLPRCWTCMRAAAERTSCSQAMRYGTKYARLLACPLHGCSQPQVTASGQLHVRRISLHFHCLSRSASAGKETPARAPVGLLLEKIPTNAVYATKEASPYLPTNFLSPPKLKATRCRLHPTSF